MPVYGYGIQNGAWFRVSDSKCDNLQCSITPPLTCILSTCMAINGNVCSHFITFALITTGAFSRNVGKLFSKLKLITDGLLFIYAEANFGLQISARDVSTPSSSMLQNSLEC